MEFLLAILIGSFVGWVCPLTGRSPGVGTLAEMLIGAGGGLVGATLALLFHVILWLPWFVWFGAALMLALVGIGKSRMSSE